MASNRRSVSITLPSDIIDKIIESSKDDKYINSKGDHSKSLVVEDALRKYYSEHDDTSNIRPNIAYDSISSDNSNIGINRLKKRLKIADINDDQTSERIDEIEKDVHEIKEAIDVLITALTT